MAKETKIEQSTKIDKEAKVAADTTIGMSKVGLKFGAMFLAHLNGGPGAAVGTAVVTELASVILAQRQARLTSFWGHLFQGRTKLPKDRQQRFDENAATSQGEQLLEFAWQQAADEVEPEKVEALAALLVNGLSSNELKSHQTRWLLELLGRVDAVEFIILKSYTTECRQDQEFTKRHSEVLLDITAGAPDSHDYRSDWRLESGDEEQRKKYREDQQRLTAQYEMARERFAIFQSRVHHLVNLGLLGASETGVTLDSRIKTDHGLTPLGAALLKITDATSDAEYGKAELVNSVQAVQRTEQKIKQESDKEDNALRYSLNTASPNIY